MIADEIFRGRFRESFERPTAITPGAVTPYMIDLHTNDHAFLKGHRIMVQIQSTWFPLYEANPQTFVENIFNVRSVDYQKSHAKNLSLSPIRFSHRAAFSAVSLVAQDLTLRRFAGHDNVSYR